MNESPLQPPINRAIACLKVFLWILPSGMTVISASAMERLSGSGLGIQLGMKSWLLCNALFIAGTGFYNAKLSYRARSEPDGVFYKVVMFFFIQLFLIPLLLAIALFLICITEPIHF